MKKRDFIKSMAAGIGAALVPVAVISSAGKAQAAEASGGFWVPKDLVNEMQFAKSREFSKEEILRAFNVPPDKGIGQFQPIRMQMDVTWLDQ